VNCLKRKKIIDCFTVIYVLLYKIVVVVVVDDSLSLQYVNARRNNASHDYTFRVTWACHTRHFDRDCILSATSFDILITYVCDSFRAYIIGSKRRVWSQRHVTKI